MSMECLPAELHPHPHLVRQPAKKSQARLAGLPFSVQGRIVSAYMSAAEEPSSAIEVDLGMRRIRGLEHLYALLALNRSFRLKALSSITMLAEPVTVRLPMNTTSKDKSDFWDLLRYVCEDAGGPDRFDSYFLKILKDQLSPAFTSDSIEQASTLPVHSIADTDTKDPMDLAGHDPFAPATSTRSMQTMEPTKPSTSPQTDTEDFDDIAAAISLMMMQTADSAKDKFSLDNDHSGTLEAPKIPSIRVTEPNKNDISLETKDFGSFIAATTTRRALPIRIPSKFTSHRVAAGSPTLSFAQQSTVVDEQLPLAWLQDMSNGPEFGGGDVTNWDDPTPECFSALPPVLERTPMLPTQAAMNSTHDICLPLDNATSISLWLGDISSGFTPESLSSSLPSPEERAAPCSSREYDSSGLSQLCELPTVPPKKRKRSSSVFLQQFAYPDMANDMHAIESLWEGPTCVEQADDDNNHVNEPSLNHATGVTCETVIIEAPIIWAMKNPAVSLN
ncbi:uncharacterized protein J4E84_010232 [Alternaria hordeiaustralica]|uniref:uncharacterized protein n=1 Tax=Alternaria hordeiaustralica TaxID=1187925 RepID=UPI0020C54697|nr:uncharacterized protein J4E84_010232 [Alternaria hordeiaustralica]KAI4675231.1 hypothetical protein J4E84_010232 [Alternaria hordeiaustralica]